MGVRTLLYATVGDFNNGGYRELRFRRLVRRWRFRVLAYVTAIRSPALADMLRYAWDASPFTPPGYVESWRDTNRKVGDAVDDLADLMEWLRDGKHYAEADRLRTITARLARSVHPDRGAPDLTRNRARTWK